MSPFLATFWANSPSLQKHIFFGLVKAKGAITKTAQISSISKKPFEITSVESSSVYLSATVNLQPDQMGYQLNATVLPQAPAGELSGEILMKTNSAIQPTIRVTILRHHFNGE